MQIGKLATVGGMVLAIAGFVAAYMAFMSRDQFSVGNTVYMSPRSWGCQNKQIMLTAQKFRAEGDRDAVTDLYEKNFVKGKCRDFETDELAIVVETLSAKALVLVRKKGGSESYWVLGNDVSLMDLATSNGRALEIHLKGR